MPPDHQRFLTEYRIRRGEDFQRVYRRRCSAADGNLIVLGCENGLSHGRLGLSVSKKYGHSPARNRWKRLLREAFRLARTKLPEGIDFVAIPRTGQSPDVETLLESLPRLARLVARRLAQTSPEDRKPGKSGQ